MSDMTYSYFIAKGRSLEAILAWTELRKRALAAMTAIFTESGAKRAVGSGSGLEIQMDVSTQQPTMPGWRRKARTSYGWIADRKTAEGKALAARLGAIHIPRLMELNVGCADVLGDGMQLYSATPEQVGEVWVIKVPLADDKPCKTPWDAEPIKTSEFWAMREAIAPVEG